ncbi:hypothetical protein A2899_05225 [Candidatus Amesbacteria bacterium RIFCSPLOWO2_01_FULL_49_25]|nr:MAG: hypothetical protein A2899_05225 [Candidatus Amesbacteria bacterium RIFCSPLOWO2_01_FULL_49_25]
MAVMGRREFLREAGKVCVAAFMLGVERNGLVRAMGDGGVEADVMFGNLREGEVNVNLFEEQEVKLQLKAQEGRYTPGFRVWQADDGEDKDAHLVMVDNGRVLNGQLRVGEKIYRFWPQPGGRVLIGEDTRRMTPESEKVVPLDELRARFPGETKALIKGSVLEGESNGLPVVKVGLVFDGTAQAYYGSSEVMESEGALTVAVGNGMFEASGVNARQALGYSGPLDYDSTGKVPDEVWRDMVWIEGMEFKWLDKLRRIRDSYALDQVVVVIDSPAQWSGMAYQGGDPNRPWGADAQFALVNAHVGPLGRQHELGHETGFCHDHETDVNGCYGATPAAFGYVGSDFSTEMAYPDVGTPWVERISSSVMLYDGEATGVAGYADNAEAGNFALPIIARYRLDVLYRLLLPLVVR